MKVNHKHIANLCSYDSETDKAGYMQKRGFFFNTEYKKRWFVLKGNLLFYFKSKTSLSDPTGVIFLENCIVKKNKTVSQPHFFHEFTVEFEGEDDVRKYYLATSSEDATDNWVKAIERACYSKMKEDLDNLQLEMFKAEMCFGIHQTVHDVSSLRPTFDSEGASASSNTNTFGDTQGVFAREDADSSEDEQHYQDSPNGSPKTSRNPSRNASMESSTRSKPDLMSSLDSSKRGSLFGNVAAPTPPTRDPNRIMKSNPNAEVRRSTSTQDIPLPSYHQASSLPSYNQATSSKR
eukprot:m.178986 g.178986  ORF g.178986 m.178986 type:complete len:292 (-) comp31954_c3_seq1:26-901(-)